MVYSVTNSQMTQLRVFPSVRVAVVVVVVDFDSFSGFDFDFDFDFGFHHDYHRDLQGSRHHQ